jgi:uncharacterized cupin superfamily protein
VAVPEASLRTTKFGLAPDGDGWFVLNARDSRWRDTGDLGKFCDFEGKKRFRQLGINLNILEPGQPMGLYHRELHQEDFLVISGECLLIVEGEERRLQAWDFFHCPGGTAHIIVGAGDGPSVVLAVGARGGRKRLVYLADATALRHGAGVERETTSPSHAYGGFSTWARASYVEGWLPNLARTD